MKVSEHAIRFTNVIRGLALALVFSVVACGGSSGRPDEFTGAIAYKRDVRLFTVDAATSRVTRIERRSSSGGLSWSPDGSTIAYSNQEGDIVLADAAGIGARLLRKPWCFGPAFSPGGSRLVCDVTEPNVVSVVDASDGSVILQTADCCYQPAWAPDGRQIAYVSYGTYDRTSGRYVGPSGLFVMNADGTHKRLVAKNVSYSDRPAWSSRGVIAFFGEGGIWTVTASGRDLRRLVAEGRYGLTWSPDGGKLAFVGGDGDYEIFVVNADGSGLANLTANEKVQDEWPSWSPDGKAITFVSSRDDRRYQVFAMRADGSGQTQLTHESGASACCSVWSPR